MKLIGLVPVRNAADTIAPCLQALARLCDEIVVLDDCSDDKTVSVVKKVAEKCRVRTILRKTVWLRDEPQDRNRLLAEGRRLQGTHFAVIDSDEMFTASWVMDGSLRKLIGELAVGGALSVRWIHPWRSLDYVRWDDSIHTLQFKDAVFRDNGSATYKSDFIHTERTPEGIDGPRIRVDKRDEGLLHFQYVNWRNVLIKQAWYRCLEHVRAPKRSLREINARYKTSCDETCLRLRPTPKAWLNGYDFFDRSRFDVPDEWRLNQMQRWFRKFKIESFAGLDIWQPEIWTAAGPDISRFLEKAPKKTSAGTDVGPATNAGEIRSLRSEISGLRKQLVDALQSAEAFKNERNLLQAQLADLQRNFAGAEEDRVERGKVIEQQGKKIASIEGEFDARLNELKKLYAVAEQTKNERNLVRAQMADLQRHFALMEKDRTKRGDIISQQAEKLAALARIADELRNERNLLNAKYADLGKNFTAVEKDRSERGKVIDRQGKDLARLEGEFDARLKELKSLYASAEEIKNERNLARAQLADLKANFEAIEFDRTERGRVIEKQGKALAKLESEFDARLTELKSLYASSEAVKNERNLLKAQLDDLGKNFSAVEADRAKRGSLIAEIGKKLTALECEFDLRLKELQRLYEAMEVVKNERNLIQAQLADLHRNFSAVEDDRTKRGDLINELGGKLSRLEGECDLRLKELQGLYETMEVVKNERNLMQAQLADLRKNFSAVEEDRLARGAVIEAQGLRIAELERLVWETEQNRDYWKSLCRPEKT